MNALTLFIEESRKIMKCTNERMGSMKYLEKIGYMAAGAAVMGMLAVPMSPAMAALAQKYIQVSPGVNIYVDDRPLATEGFIYDGTTYLPVRAVSEAVGKAVSWDGRTSSVYIGQHSSNEPIAALTDLDYFNMEGGLSIKNGQSAKDNLGRTYNYGYICIYRNGFIEYKLNGEISRLTGTYFVPYKEHSTGQKGTLKIWGDGKLLYTSPEMTGGIEPVEVDVDLTGVLTLKIEMNTMHRDTFSTNFTFADILLYQ